LQAIIDFLKSDKAISYYITNSYFQVRYDSPHIPPQGSIFVHPSIRYGEWFSCWDLDSFMLKFLPMYDGLEEQIIPVEQFIVKPNKIYSCKIINQEEHVFILLTDNEKVHLFNTYGGTIGIIYKSYNLSFFNNKIIPLFKTLTKRQFSGIFGVKAVSTKYNIDTIEYSEYEFPKEVDIERGLKNIRNKCHENDRKYLEKLN